MSFIVYDLVFLSLFTLGVIWFLWKKRANLEREGILYLYKTKLGMKVLDYIGKKYQKTLAFMSYLIVIVGYILMIFFTYYMVKVVYVYLVYPQIIQVFDGPPLMLLIPYFPQIFGVKEFFPEFYFVYFLIAIAVVAIAHEGFHGIFMRRYGIKIKSTGFGFLGPILAFFVEQDEKDMTKKAIFPQLTVLAAGVFANLLVAAIFLVGLILFFNVSYVAHGVIIAGYSSSLIPISESFNAIQTNETIQINNETLIQLEINNKKYFAKEAFIEMNQDELNKYKIVQIYQDQPAIRNGIKGNIIKINEREIKSVQDIQTEILEYAVGDEIQIQTDYKGEVINYQITLGESFEEEGKPVIGIGIGPENPLWIFAIIDNAFKEPEINYEPKAFPEFTEFIFFLLEWIILINVLVALFNMLPVGIFDGGRFFYLSVLAITKKEKIANIAFKFTTIALLLMGIALMVIWVLRRFIL